MSDIDPTITVNQPAISNLQEMSELADHRTVSELTTIMLSDEVTPFRTWLLDNGASQSTRYNYPANVNSFLRSLPLGVAADLSRLNVQAYLNHLADTHRPRSVNRQRYAISKFCVYLLEKGGLAENPVTKIKNRKLDKPLRDVPTTEQVAAILAAADRIHAPYRRALARAVLTTLVFSGLRRSELLHVQLGDVDLAQGSVHVRHGKGDRARTVYPNRACIDALRVYMGLRAECPEQRLFLHRRNVALADYGLRSILLDLQAIAGHPNSRSLLPHGFRHACASRLNDAGAPITDIRDFLGHSLTATTYIYIHGGDEQQRRLAELTALPGAPPTPPTAPAPPPATRPILRMVRGDAKKDAP